MFGNEHFSFPDLPDLPGTNLRAVLGKTMMGHSNCFSMALANGCETWRQRDVRCRSICFMENAFEGFTDRAAPESSAIKAAKSHFVVLEICHKHHSFGIGMLTPPSSKLNAFVGREGVKLV